MKIFSFILLLFLFLLSGCFSGKTYPSGLLVSSELRKAEEERRMMELKQTHLLRLGVSKKEEKNIAEIRKTLKEKGWDIQVILCPEKRLTGLLRSGALDLIYLPGVTKEDAERWDLYYLPPALLLKNRLLFQNCGP